MALAYAFRPLSRSLATRKELAPIRASFDAHAAFCEKLNRLSGDPLEASGGRIVIFRGNSRARLMVIGEAPGEDEDRLGVPYVGKAGQLLDKILCSVNFDPERDVYITNVVKRRPPENRDPLVKEMQFYKEFLLEEINIVDPQVIVLTGRHAMRAVLDEAKGITLVRGTWYQREHRWIMPIFHPSYLLRNPDRRRGTPKWKTWEDIQEIRRKWEELTE
mmetsp:Transcript_17051/g.35465  ORF Transcript_17051/g.35465 Transcript_17051/m.35465 type:complete len:218 (+) Transcript_17051:2532-3185(+)